MSARIYTTPKLKIETNGRYEMETMHLMDTQADEEKALCGANVPADDLTGVDNYMERRKDGLPVGTVCERCKALAMPLVPLLRLAHLRVALLSPILCRRRCRDDARVHYRPLLKTKTL